MNTQDKTKEELLLELGELKKENDRLKASIKNNEKTNFTSEQLYYQSPEIAKHTQQNYETFFNTIDDFLFVLDEQGNIIHTNTTVNKRLNYTPDELLGKSVLMVHPIERQEEAGRITGEMLSGVTEFCPVPIITKSGVQIPVETRVSHGFWDGKPVIFGVSKDISKIKFSEEKFSKLFYLNPSACGLSELNEHKYTEVNDAFYNLLGFNKDEVIGKTPFELGIITDEALNTIRQNADSEGKITNANADLVAKNGDIKHVLLTAENIYVQDKKYRFTVVNDITELINSENEKKIAANALKDSESRMREIMENSQDAAYKRDLITNCYHYFSPVFTRISGYKISEIIDMPLKNTIKLIHQDDLAEMDRILNDSLTDTSNKANNIIYRFKHKEGHYIWLSDKYTVMRDADDQPLALIGSVSDITKQHSAELARKHAEEKLLDEKRLLSSIIENIPYQIYYKDLESRFIQCNPAVASNCGAISTTEMIGKTDFDFFPHDLAQQYFDEEKSIMKSGISLINHEEICINKATDHIRWNLSTKVPIKDSTGSVIGLIGINRDITTQKLAEETLLRSEEKYRLIAEKISDVVWLMDLNGKSLFVSQSIEKFTGYTVDEYLNQTINDRFTKDSAAIALETLQKEVFLYTNEKTPLNDYKKMMIIDYRCKDGGVKTGEVLITPYFDEDNICIGLHGVTRDITARIAAEKAAKLAEETLRESEQRYRLLIETSNEGILVAQDAYLKFVNPMLQELTGYTKKELLSKPFTEFIHPDDREMIINSYIKRLSGESTNHVYSFRLIKKDKSQKWVEITGALMQWEGKPATINFISDITERISAEASEKQANEKLKESQLKYQSIVENTDDILWTMNPDFTFDYISPSVYKFLGYTVEEHMKHSLDDFFTPESAKKVAEEFQIGMMHLQKKEYDKLRNKAELEIEFIRKDKTHGIGIIAMMITRDEQHRITKIRGVTTDITDKKQALEDVRRANSFLNSVIDNIPNMIFIKEAQELRFVRFNRAGEYLLGVSEKEMLGKNDYDFFSQDEAESFTNQDKAVLINNKMVDIPEEILSTVNKGIRIIHTKKVPILNSSGKPEYLLGISEDITEQKQIEKQKNLSSELLGFLNSDNDMQNIMYNIAKAIQNTMQFSAVGIRIKDGKNFPYISQTGLSDSFLSTENNLTAEKQTDNKSKTKKDKPLLECTCGLVISGKTNSLLTDNGSFWTNDYEILMELQPELDPRLSPRNKCIHFGYNSVALIPIKTNKEIIGLLQINEKKKGAFTGEMITFFENICFSIIGTAIMRKQAIKALIKSEEEIRSNLLKEKELNTLRSQFISTISHEFRTPLSGILSSVQLLKLYNEKWNKEKKDQIYDRIFGAIEHTESLLKGVSIIERSENNKIALNPTFLNLNDLLLNIIEENKQVYGPDFIIDTKFILFKTEYFLDPEVIRYIVGNVLSNAIKYSGNSQNIQFNVIEKKCDLVFNIIDFGIGIPKEDQDFLFEPFKRASNVKDIMGTGFGLNIVKRFVDLCGGCIEFKSELGKGTSVIIKIPIGKKS